jgi:O-antigen/teichoic acid export membrane protein
MGEYKVKSVKVNAALNGVKNILKVVFPLITFPYVARILGVENLGKINFAQSIISYFTMFAALGISTYGVREGAKLRDNKEKLGKFANEIFTVNLITTFLSYAALIFVVFAIPRLRLYRPEILILSIAIAFNTIGVDWVNSIYEDYFYITIRSIVVQLINLILLFLLVREKSDIYVYAFLIALTPVLTGILNFFYCRRYVRILPTIHCNFRMHIKPMLVFFANAFAITIYCDSDMTMLGAITSDYYTGIYAVAVKVYNVIKNFGAAVILVTVPRLSNYYAQNKRKESEKLIQGITEVFILLVIPLTALLIILSPQIVVILGGTQYVDATLTLRILGVALLFSLFGGIITNCVNIPTGKETLNLNATIIAAVINIGLNFILIPVFKQDGAAFTTALAELAVIVVCLIKNHDWIKLYDKRRIANYMIQALIGTVCYLIAWFFMNEIVGKYNLFMCVGVFLLGSILYAIILTFFKNEYLRKSIMNIKNKVRR